MKKLDKMLYFVFGKGGASYIDSAIGVNELAKIYNKSRINMLRSLNNYYKKDSFIYLGKDKTIIISEEDLRKGEEK